MLNCKYTQIQCIFDVKCISVTNKWNRLLYFVCLRVCLHECLYSCLCVRMRLCYVLAPCMCCANKQKLKRLHKKNTIHQYVYFPYKKVSTHKVVFIKTKIIREQINTQSNKKRKTMENNTTSKIPWSCWKWHRHCSVHIALHLFRSGVHTVVINRQKQFYLFSQARKHMESCPSLRNFRRNLNFQVTMLVFPG